MTHDVVLPRLGDMTESVVVVSWYVTPGSAISQDEPLVRVETDKIETDVFAPVSGTVADILAPEGSEVAVGDVIATIEVS